jgi:hypothetical protein
MSPTASPVNDILYPAIEPYHSDYLQVSALHQLYFEQCGQPQGLPVLFMHGGPGVAASPYIGGSSTHRPIASSSSINAAPAAHDRRRSSPTIRHRT